MHETGQPRDMVSGRGTDAAAARPLLRWAGLTIARLVLAAVALSLVVSRGPGTESTTARAGAVAASPSPNFTVDPDANARAADAVDALGPALEKDQTFGGLRIVASGVEVSTVRRPSAFVLDAIATIRRQVPVSVRSVSHSMLGLSALVDRIGADADRWRVEGIDISGIGPDVADNRVSIEVRRYSPAFAEQLEDAYGEMVTVTRRDVEYQGS
jgi:hypothetical protein